MTALMHVGKSCSKNDLNCRLRRIRQESYLKCVKIEVEPPISSLPPNFTGLTVCIVAASARKHGLSKQEMKKFGILS